MACKTFGRGAAGLLVASVICVAVVGTGVGPASAMHRTPLVYVANYGGSMSVVSTATNSITATVPTGSFRCGWRSRTTARRPT